jgi:hypothetical protein
MRYFGPINENYELHGEGKLGFLNGEAINMTFEKGKLRFIYPSGYSIFRLRLNLPGKNLIFGLTCFFR